MQAGWRQGRFRHCSVYLPLPDYYSAEHEMFNARICTRVLCVLALSLRHSVTDMSLFPRCHCFYKHVALGNRMYPGMNQSTCRGENIVVVAGHLYAAKNSVVVITTADAMCSEALGSIVTSPSR